jgi:serine/threonine protein kinase/tetratricopeptide (TPR) repeat protein
VADDPQVLRALEEYLCLLETPQPPDRQAFLQRFPEIADLLAEALDGLELIRAATPGMQGNPDDRAGAPPAVAEALARRQPLGDFRLLREVGRGGMGIIFEAEQLSLGRRVALKVLPFAATLDPKHLQRFRNEAQAAAHLHHPHIVPVHGVGCERAVHYYAMQLIDGQTLADLIRGLRHRAQLDPDPVPAATGSAGGQAAPAGADGSTVDGEVRGGTLDASLPDAQSPAFVRTVAHWGVQAAEALEHAHEMGVVHRDIKPANLMVDRGGHLWITDFGLARLRDHPELTLSGDLVGTLRYMSPEQARARPLLVDHRTDIYSLGASLYELLTLEPACRGDDRQELLQQIASQEPRPIRQLNPAVPPELETVVLKALAKEPGERYATAQELADDLRRYLEDRPIRATPPMLWQRLRRQARRHRAVVATALVAAGLLVLVVIAALALGYTSVAWERDQKEEALNQARASASAADDQRRQAEANFQLAYQAVDEIYVQFADEFARRPQLYPLQHVFLRKALAFYQEFARQKSNDPDVRFKTATTCVRLADIRRNLWQFGPAEEPCDRAITLLESLTAEYPSEPRYRALLGKAYGLKAMMVMNLRRDHQTAEQALRRATVLWQKLVNDFPQEPSYRLSLAEGYNSLGAELLPRPGEAEAAHRVALALCEQLVADFGDKPAYRAARGTSYRLLAKAQAASGQIAQAEASCRAALVLLDFSGGAYSVLGEMLEVNGRSREAVAAYQQACIAYEKWLAEMPYAAATTEWNALCRCYERLILLLDSPDRGAQAAQYLGRALDLFERFLSDLPDEPSYLEGALPVAQQVSALLKVGGECRDREKLYRRALGLVERLAARPGAPTASLVLRAYWYGTLGSLLTADGKPREAEAVYRRAEADYSAILNREPNQYGSLNNLAWFLATCPDPRLRDPRRAVELARKATTLQPQRPVGWNTLGIAQYRAGDWEAARRTLTKSIELYASRSPPATLESFNTFFLAMAHWQLGERERARQWYDRAVRWMEKYQAHDEELLRIRAEAAALIGGPVAAKPGG